VRSPPRSAIAPSTGATSAISALATDVPSYVLPQIAVSALLGTLSTALAVAVAEEAVHVHLDARAAAAPDRRIDDAPLRVDHAQGLPALVGSGHDVEAPGVAAARRDLDDHRVLGARDDLQPPGEVVDRDLVAGQRVALGRRLGEGCRGGGEQGEGDRGERRASREVPPAAGAVTWRHCDGLRQGTTAGNRPQCDRLPGLTL